MDINKMVRKKNNNTNETVPLLESRRANKTRTSMPANLSSRIRRKILAHLYFRIPRRASRTRKALILACCFMMQFTCVGVGTGLSVMYVEIQRVFDSPRSEAALIQSIYMGIMTAAGLCYTPIIQKFGPGICVMAGTLIGCIGFFVSGLATSVLMVIMLTGVLSGIFMSILYLAPFLTASLMFREDASVPLVFVTTGVSAGQFIFVYLYEIFISTYGWRGAFFLVAGVSLNCVPAGLLVYTTRDYMASTSGDLGSHQKKKLCDFSLLSDPVILLVLSACFTLALTGNAELWFLVDIMIGRGYERQTGSLFVSLIGLINFFGRATGVILRLKLSIPTIYHWIYCMPILALSHYLVLIFTDYVPLLCSCLLYGYIFGVTVAQTPAIMFEAAGLEKYPHGMSFVNICYGAGIFVGGFIGGVFKDTYGNYDPLFYMAIALSLYDGVVALVVIYMMKRRTRHHRNNENNSDTGYQSLKEDSC